MRVNLLLNGPFLRNAIAGLVIGGAVIASCSFSPGPAGSAQSSGSGTGNPLLGSAASSGTGTAAGTAGVTGTSSGGAAMSPNPDGANCGLSQYGLENVPPDLLIVLDKSGSMAQQPDGTDCPMGGGVCDQKWPDMTAAINMVVAQTEGTIRWGLKYFANDNNCAVNPGAAVDIAPNNAMAIATSIMGTRPGGSTPTRLGVASGATYLMGLTDPNPKFILLATDGIPNCIPGMKAGNVDQMGAIQAVTDAAMAGFPVFVVGVGNVADAVTTLNGMAVAGGRAQAGDPKYYPVSSTADLVAVLTKIGGQITSCSFALGRVPPVPTNVGVYGDGTKIPQDPTHVNGWDYGAGQRSIELFGAACDGVKNKTIKNIQAIFGCPGQVVP
jgi:hypothetical protein